MAVKAILGMQWGDEGKGKIIDGYSSGLFGEKYGVVVRSTGGNNAGHTVTVRDRELDRTMRIILHLIPSGILTEDVACIIGNGTVLDLGVLCDEIDSLERTGISFENRFHISGRAQVIMPYHLDVEDRIAELLAIGTTRRGIGPAYEDKVSRIGIRIKDFETGSLRKKLEQNLKIKRVLGVDFDVDEVYEKQMRLYEKIEKYVANTSYMINGIIDRGENVLFEGAQGAMLDIDHGTNPFVTSSNSTIGGIVAGSGVGALRFDNVTGIVKAYTTRVGNGTFPTELGGTKMEEYCARGVEFDEDREHELYDIGKLLSSDDDFEVGIALRMIGKEYGATTKRPRRCGWFDAVALRYAAQLNSLSEIAITKLDTLGGFRTLKLCTGYRKPGGEVIDEFPDSIEEFEDCEPVYEEMPGWSENINRVETFEELPANSVNYLKRIEELTHTPVTVISVGPERGQTIIRS